MIDLRYGRDVLEALREIPDATVQCCVTSPPYYGLRSYLPNGVSLRGDLSQQETDFVISELEKLGIKPVQGSR